MKTTEIGIGHLIKGMQLAGFGHQEIMAMRQFLLDNKGEAMGVGMIGRIGFVDDCYSEDWEDNICIIKEIYK
jgi:hypothetical protein